MDNGRARCPGPGVDVISLSSQGRLECSENKLARTPFEVSWNLDQAQHKESSALSISEASSMYHGRIL